MVKRIVLFVVVAAALTGVLLWSQQRPAQEKVSGVIEADEIRLGSRVGGRVKEVLVEEGMAVDRNTPLVVLEEYDLRERLAEAKAVVAQRQQEFAKLQGGFRAEDRDQALARYQRFAAMVDRMDRPPRLEEVEAARAQVRLANAKLERAQQQMQRLRDLFARQPDAVPQDQRDRAAEEVKVAQANAEVRQKELEILNQGTREEERREARAQRDEAFAAWMLAENGYQQEEIDQAEAALQAAEAAVRVIEKQLEELTIRSTVDGVVEALELQPGDLVSPSAPVMSVLDTNRLWVRAYVPQGDLDVRLGQEVVVTVDAFGDRKFPGEVTFVSRQAEFTPSNVQTFEERAKQMFRIKVTLDKVEDTDAELRPGMTADVWLRGT